MISILALKKHNVSRSDWCADDCWEMTENGWTDEDCVVGECRNNRQVIDEAKDGKLIVYRCIRQLNRFVEQLIVTQVKKNARN